MRNEDTEEESEEEEEEEEEGEEDAENNKAGDIVVLEATDALFVDAEDDELSDSL